MRILNEILDISFNLLARYWMIALPVCILAFTLAVWLLVRIIRGKSTTSQPAARVSGTPKATSRAALSSLRRLPPEHYRIFNDVFIPRLDGEGNTQLHHIVLSRFGVFVIQGQPEDGLITGGLEDRDWTLIQADSRKRFINPIIRSTYHLKALAKFLELPESSLLPIIYFDAEPRFEAARPPYLLTGGLGRYIISHHEELLTVDELDEIALKFACLTSHRDPQAAMEKHQAARARRLRHTRERAA